MDSFSYATEFQGIDRVSNTTEQYDNQVFENPSSQAGNPMYSFLGGIGLIIFAIVAFIFAMGTRPGQMMLHMTTTMPTIIAIGLLTRGFLLRSQPIRIVVGPDGMEITTKQSTRRFSWSEIGSSTKTNILNSNKTCLRVTDAAGKSIVRIDESFPGYQRLVNLVEFHIDAKQDDTSFRIMSRNAKRVGILSFAFGCFLAAAAVFIALTTRESQRAQELLLAKGVPGEAELVRRFVAPNGVTKRINYRINGSKIMNVQVEPSFWDKLEHAKAVSVVYVPEEPDISRLQFGEAKNNDFTKSRRGGYLLAGLGGLMALLFIALSPFAWWGYDLAFEKDQKIWQLKRYGRVIWSTKRGAFNQMGSP